MRKCEHKTVIPVWLQAIGGSYRCYKCGALGVRSLGPSNDSGEAARIEILAAELGQSPEVWARFMDLDRVIERDLRRVSGRDSTWVGLGATSPTAGHLDVKGGPNWTDGQLGDYLAGWLARDVSGDAGDAFTWSWDPTLPIADQQPGNANCPRHPTAGRHADGDCAECHFERVTTPTDADDDEHHDADVDARFDVTDEVMLPDEVSR